MGARTGKKKLSFDEAVTKLAEVRQRVVVMAAEHSTLGDDVAKQVAALREPVNALGKKLQGLRLYEASLQRMVDKGPGQEAPVRERVENPDRSGDLVQHQLEEGAVEDLVKDNRFAGLVEVDVRLSTRIGGLARIKERNEWQTLAAARFRSLWDQAQIGGAKAIDYSQVRVDTSGTPADAVSSAGEDARREYAAAVQQLGMVKANLVQRVVCDDLSLRALGRKLGRPDGYRAREALKVEVLDSVDVLVRVFKMGPAQSRGGIRAEAERPTDWGRAKTDGEEHEEAA